MEQIAVSLTPADRMILESYKTMAEGLSDYLGSGYEIVLHSLENLDRSVIKILNGYHTGRREGAPITDLALEMLARIKETGGDPPYISYFTKNKRTPQVHHDRHPRRARTSYRPDVYEFLSEHPPGRCDQFAYAPPAPAARKHP